MLRNRQIESLLVGGVTDGSLRQRQNDGGYRCIVLADACASYFPEVHAAGLAMINAQGGIFGRVSDTAATIDAFAKRAARVPPGRRPASSRNS